MVLEQTQKPDALQNYLEESAFNKIKRMITESAGLNTSGYRDEYLKRRFEIRLRATGTNTYARYIIYLKKHPEEYANLLNDLTVNYTTFFRDGDVYEHIEKKLLPKLLFSKNPVKIWSAGCASGEEPYSISILVHKVFGPALSRNPVTIFASDIDKDALTKAQNGVYTKRQLITMDQRTTDKYFTKEGENYQAKDFLKRIINFEQFDLMKTPLHTNLDLILCRNVMIYFSKEGQQHIHMNFYRALRDGGFFITGKSEILSGEPAQVFTALDYTTRVYQKPPKPLF
jgi:chemotaxis protein methyltransferase CheR